MAIEIIPKPKIQAPRWATILFIVCIILILLFFGSYFYFGQSSQKITKEIQNIQTEEQILTETYSDLEKELLSTEKKINNFEKLFSTHQKPLNTLAFLEEATHPQIWFTDFNFNSQKNLLILKGRTASFVALGQQLLVLKNEQILKDINLSEVSLSKEEGIDFTLQLTLDPRFLQQ